MHSQSIAPWQHHHVFLGEKHDRHARRTWLVVGLTAVMMVAEIGGGTVFGSMALVADGWHMSTHAGALAIAALAYGTETIAPVDKVVGPGNAFVNEAKLLVSRDVAVDLSAGPSEVVVLVSDGADLAVAELELAAQREHGADAVCRLVEADGDLEGALARVEALAPEHLVLLGEEAERLAPRVRNAGAVFVGRWSPVAAGDYATGGNHVLPTGGRARAVGGLGLEAFLKPVTVQRLTPEGLAQVRPVVEALAALEGMPAHAEAVRR